MLPGNFVTIYNNNWKETQGSSAPVSASSTFGRAAILATLDPGSYTAIVTGYMNTSGVCLLEPYDLDQEVDSKLANLSARAQAGAGDNVVIAGFLLNNGAPDHVIIRGIGPSLAGILPANKVLADPTLELRDANGMLIQANDN